MSSCLWKREDAKIEKASRSVRSLAKSAPKRSDLTLELADAEAAEQRGYFLPDEDERLRDVFADYLSLRIILLDVADEMGAVYQGTDSGSREEDWRRCLRAFVVGFTAAALLVRMGSYLVNLTNGRPVVTKKLDEAEPRYGIPAKSFTEVYKNLSSSRRMWRFHEALLFYETNKEDISQLLDDAVTGELVLILKEEEDFLRYKKTDYLKRKFHYGLHTFKRRHISGYRKVMFHLLKLGGSTIAEMHQPFIKSHGQGKRVTESIRNQVKSSLKAGDVLVTRHDDAMSNLFLPGFWPHMALYIGDANERDRLGISRKGCERAWEENVCFLEAKKDGVLFRTIEETMHVDAFMVLRPQLAPHVLVTALERAMSHEGKLYDFSFDFSMADRLACTEVIYRAYHSLADISFSLSKHSGRLCLSAEDLIKQALSDGAFSKVLDFGVNKDEIRMFQPFTGS